MMEIERLILLRPHVERFMDEYQKMPEHCILDSEDWENLNIYVTSLKTLANASSVMEGQKYPTASTVIPYLDQVFTDLEKYTSKLHGDGQDFPKCLLKNLKSRFPSGLRTTSPYNFLNCLDPRFMDIYLTDAEISQALEDMYFDDIYKKVRTGQVSNAEQGGAEINLPTVPTTASTDQFAIRRAQLLAARMVNPSDNNGRRVKPKDKLKTEMDKYFGLRATVNHDTDPLLWWRDHKEDFPTLARFFRAYCAFPATNTSSERVFNMEANVVTDARKSLTPERCAAMIMSRDYILQRRNVDAYTLCEKCPKPPSLSASYVLQCNIHNK